MAKDVMSAVLLQSYSHNSVTKSDYSFWQSLDVMT